MNVMVSPTVPTTAAIVMAPMSALVMMGSPSMLMATPVMVSIATEAVIY